ncbi:MAG TPA: hypothetical protein VKV37_04440 [Ktedonobacteraceae bacterium]|nr:hypothetical protein [Ktedonobacteraceae bacterium]
MGRHLVYPSYRQMEAFNYLLHAWFVSPVTGNLLVDGKGFLQALLTVYGKCALDPPLQAGDILIQFPKT